MKAVLFGLMTLLALPAISAETRPLEVVPFVDLSLYAGKWFEVARLPNRFQRDCTGATAEYGVRPDGAISVLNTCYLEDGSTRSIEGEAKPLDEETHAKLQVRFDGFWFKLFSWLIKANYWIIDLAEDYSYAVVGTPNREFLWILSRERTMDDPTYDRLVARISRQGFEVERLIRTSVPDEQLQQSR